MQQSAEEKMVNLAQKLAWETVKFRSSGRLRPATSHIEKALYATKSIQARDISPSILNAILVYV